MEADVADKIGYKKTMVLCCGIAYGGTSDYYCFLNQLQYEKFGLDNAAIGYIYIIATLLGEAGILLFDCVAVGTNLGFGALAEAGLVMAYWFGAGICVVSVILFL
ncbi:MAG: hypothetical protein K2H52_06710 [Lachnospiraceae bacterium]|nr:hypothetical protein [Lachnospiraceae bacterium]